MEDVGATMQQAIYALFADSQRVGIRRYEDGGSLEVSQRLTPEVTALLDRGLAILRELIDRYEVAPPSESVDELDLGDGDDLTSAIPVLARPPEALLADTAFMAHADLTGHRQRLAGHRPDGEVQEMIADCGSALRGLKKSLYAVEPLLCSVTQAAPLLPSSLETSLTVRRHYRKLWTFAILAGDVTPTSVRAALRGAGTRISILAGSEVYALLREDDRFYIRELQVRILEWLRNGTDQHAAIRIWQDFALFVEILRQVNLREELVRHDRELLVATGELLANHGDDALEKVRQMLRPSLGVDDVLDEAITNGVGARQLLRELRRVAAHLGAPSEELHAQPVAS